MSINPQTAYSLELANGYQGDLASTRDHVVDARRNDLAASAEALYGLFYCASTNADGLGFGLADATHQALGILVHSQDLEKTEGVTLGMINGEFGSIMHQGRAWVKVMEAVTLASPVRVAVGDDSGNVTGATAGNFLTTADSSGHTTALLTNARFVTAQATPGGLAIVEIGALPAKLTAD
jgi:hypothetical protein